MNDAANPIYDYWTAPDSQKVQGYLRRAERYGEDEYAIEDARFIDTFVAPRYAGRTVLDFGAGPGRMVHTWARHNVKLTSTDWSESFYPVLAEHSRTVGCDSHRLDIIQGRLDQRFELVFSTQVLLHIHPRDIGNALDNARAMAERDLLFITWQDLNRPFDPPDTDRVQSFNHDYKQLFEEHGLDLYFELDLHIAKKAGGRATVTNKIYMLHTA